MFSSKEKSQNPGPAALNLIGAGTVISGDVKSNGDLRLDGSLVGTLESKAKVVLGPSAQLEGSLSAANADIAGNVKGVVKVNDVLVLKAGAVIDGDIIAKRLVVELGARFNGTCTMNTGEPVKLIADQSPAGEKFLGKEKILAS